jgi:hypothetical protein
MEEAEMLMEEAELKAHLEEEAVQAEIAASAAAVAAVIASTKSTSAYFMATAYPPPMAMGPDLGYGLVGGGEDPDRFAEAVNAAAETTFALLEIACRTGELEL